MRKPKFPGYRACLAMMRKHAADIREEGFHLLLPHAAEHVEELMADFQAEKDHGLRCWLLELVGEARSEKAFALLCEQLASSDASLRDWAIRGLQELNTKDARRVLFEAGVSKETAR